MASFAYSPSRQARMAKLNTIMEDDMDLRSRARAAQNDISPVPSLTETISSYYQSVRYSSDPNDWQWNDLYDASDDERMSRRQQAKPRLQVHIRPASGASEQENNRDSWITDVTNSAVHTPLAIPSPSHWPTIDKLRYSQQAGTLSPAAQMPISPLALSMLPSQPPAPSRTPSLDSLTSGDTASSAPTSPSVDLVVDKHVWTAPQVAVSSCASSVYDSDCEQAVGAADVSRFSTAAQLPQDAMRFLQNLTVEIPVMEAPETPRAVRTEAASEKEMIEVPIKLSSKPSFEQVPQSAHTEYSISQLSIPSPGGFLASLDSSAAQAWAIPQSAGPDSTTAEQFYNAPWSSRTDNVREQVVEVSAQQTFGPATALKLEPTPLTAKPVALEPVGNDYDDAYKSDLKKAAEMTMDRTSSWLQAQSDYLDERLNDGTAPSKVASPKKLPISAIKPAASCGLHRRTSSAPMPKKKVVKFLDTNKANQEYRKKSGPLSSGSDPLFYQAFQHISNLTSPTDSFTARQARYDALQARRSSVSKTHKENVVGNYVSSPEPTMPAPQRPISILPGNEPEMTFEQRVFAQAERERDALEQVAPSMWVVEALRFLSGGRLLNSPAAEVLRTAPPVGRISNSQIRVLDLGGQPSCDWAWHCAREYPNVKTYTASADPRIDAANVRGPSNHRLVAVDSLWKLPFPDNHFDAVSARSLFAHLKANQRVAELSQDQLDATLAECMRVLRPGGYLEFFILDAEVVRGGPRGTAASVEFGYKLRQRGYEPNPTKAWLGRVRRAGFVDIKRAWMFLPMGALRENSGDKDMPATPPPDASVFDERIKGAEAVQGPVGGAADVAEVSGLVGSWLWEQWILKLEMEMGKTGGDLGANVGGVVEEGRKTGSGWRSLSGWAKKPE